MKTECTKHEVAAKVLKRLASNNPDIDWFFHHCLTKSEKDLFDKWLVETGHPLAFQAGTQEFRFKQFSKQFIAM